MGSPATATQMSRLAGKLLRRKAVFQVNDNAGNNAGVRRSLTNPSESRGASGSAQRRCTSSGRLRFFASASRLRRATHSERNAQINS